MLLKALTLTGKSVTPFEAHGLSESNASPLFFCAKCGRFVRPVKDNDWFFIHLNRVACGSEVMLSKHDETQLVSADRPHLTFYGVSQQWRAVLSLAKLMSDGER